MKISLETIKREIELKRKNNEKLLKELKEKSKIYNAEKHKNNYLNTNKSFLKHKRKLTNEENKNCENEISYDINNSDNDEIENYNESFLDNTFTSNKSFRNLNFSRPQRFSLNIFNKNNKNKFYIKKAELFSITKPKKVCNFSESSNYSLCLSGNISYKENKIANNKNNEDDLFSNSNNANNNPNNNDSNSQSSFLKQIIMRKFQKKMKMKIKILQAYLLPISKKIIKMKEKIKIVKMKNKKKKKKKISQLNYLVIQID